MDKIRVSETKEIYIKLRSSFDDLIDEEDRNHKKPESSIDEVTDKGTNYKRLDVEIPLWIYFRLQKKGMLESDFLIMLGKSFCDADFIKEVITLEDKKEIEKLHRILGDLDEDIDKK